MLDQPANNKAVVDTVGIGCDYIGKRERAITVVALPEDVKVVIYDAVASYLVGKDERHVANAVGEKAVEEPPRKLAGDDSIVKRCVAVGFDREDVGDYTVLTKTAQQGMGKQRVAINSSSLKGIGHRAGTDKGQDGIVDVVDDGEAVV